MEVAALTFVAQGTSASVAPEALVSAVNGGNKIEALTAEGRAVMAPTSLEQEASTVVVAKASASGASAFVAPEALA